MTINVGHHIKWSLWPLFALNPVTHWLFCVKYFFPKLHLYAPALKVPSWQSRCSWCCTEFSKAFCGSGGRGRLKGELEDLGPSHRAICWCWAPRRNEVCLHHLAASGNRAKGNFHPQHTSPASLNSKNTDEAFAVSGNSKWMQKAHLLPGIKWEFSLHLFFPHTNFIYHYHHSKHRKAKSSRNKIRKGVLPHQYQRRHLSNLTARIDTVEVRLGSSSHILPFAAP